MKSPEVMDEYDSCRPAFMKLDIKRKSYGPAMILGEVWRGARSFFAALGMVWIQTYHNFHTISFVPYLVVHPT